MSDYIYRCFNCKKEFPSKKIEKEFHYLCPTCGKAEKNKPLKGVLLIEYDYQNLKNGRDFKINDDQIIANAELTLDPPKILQYAFCSDTMYDEKIIPYLKEIDLLYHESTFLEDRRDMAEKTKHATALQAATIAKKANVKQLILGHYSSRYKNLDLFLEEAKNVFDRVELSEAGKAFLLTNQN